MLTYLTTFVENSKLQLRRGNLQRVSCVECCGDVRQNVPFKTAKATRLQREHTHAQNAHLKRVYTQANTNGARFIILC